MYRIKGQNSKKSDERQHQKHIIEDIEYPSFKSILYILENPFVKTISVVKFFSFMYRDEF